MSTKMIDHLSNDIIVDHDLGLNLAIAFTAYDTNQEQILDPSYGELVFNAYEWGVDEKGDYFTREVHIPSHTCTNEELGYAGKESSFYPFDVNTEEHMKVFRKKFLCIDKEQMYINGDFDSEKARQI